MRKNLRNNEFFRIFAYYETSNSHIIYRYLHGLRLCKRLIYVCY